MEFIVFRIVGLFLNFFRLVRWFGDSLVNGLGLEEGIFYLGFWGMLVKEDI